MKISLKSKKIKNGKLSLFLELYKGHYIDKNGVNKYDRDFEYLKLYPLEKPTTSEDKRKNKEIYTLAEKSLPFVKQNFIKVSSN